MWPGHRRKIQLSRRVNPIQHHDLSVDGLKNVLHSLEHFQREAGGPALVEHFFEGRPPLERIPSRPAPWTPPEFGQPINRRLMLHPARHGVWIAVVYPRDFAVRI